MNGFVCDVHVLYMYMYIYMYLHCNLTYSVFF